MEPLLLKPRTIYNTPSNLRNESLNCASKHSKASKVQEFLSRHKSYIRQKKLISTGQTSAYQNNSFTQPVNQILYVATPN